MKIGIDISQLAYPNTGVANYLKELVEHLIALDKANEYILFYSSMRKDLQFSVFNFSTKPQNFKLKKFKLPPSVLTVLWNKLHILPIEFFIGNVDIFLSSDWTQPPSKKAKMITILYDLIIMKYPQETHNQTAIDIKKARLSSNIVANQKRRLSWVKKECDAVICISESTKKDAIELLGIDEKKLKVVYPG